MGTLISVLNIAREAIAAEQSAVNVTANNVANQNTPGYTREVSNFVAQDTYLLNGHNVGDGVLAGQPTSVRDRVLEQRVQQQTQIQSQSAAIQSALSDVESIFGVTSTTTSSSVTQLGSAVNAFFSALTALAANPSDTPTRQQVLSAASTLSATFNAESSQISQITTSLQGSALNIVGQVNTLLSTVATLNAKIAAQSPNTDAGVLEDQRQAAINQLSQYIGLDEINTSNNGIELTTANGGFLVSGPNSYPLSATVLGGTVQVLAGPNFTNVTSGLTGGSLGGTLQALTTSIPPLLEQLDTLAYSIATAVNTQNEAGVDANGNPGAALFTIGTTAPGSAATIAAATTNGSLVATAGPGEGSTGNTNASALAALGTALIAGGQTASSYLASALATIGEAAATANNDSTLQQATLTQLTTQRNSLSGVSLDQEAADLSQYQRSYQAASQLFSIIDTLFATVLNLGVVTTVS
ncbi:flagellar hook-associated protein 1 FlgK [Granulicella aggregans]|uniref:Flagellar hook-associated protein 1 n=1 Tax=Granulicella aggregans TaxID=474949 RepID=A0A7W7ZE06_9BACT|nr:flagellar hook-associated protein FlgK [Granulicella aggregans]MBB5057854.1 flagellar hook-associated protein 1 FlgK [Granulicella aggregans]